MVFVILNIALVALLFWFSTLVESVSDKKSSRPLINIVLLLAFNCVFMVIALIIGLKNQTYLLASLCKLFMFGFGTISVLSTVFVWLYPKEQKNFFSIIFTLLGVGVSFYVCFFTFNAVTLNSEVGLSISSENVWKYSFNWYEAYVFTYGYVLPALALLGALIKYKFAGTRLIRQQILIIMLGVITGAILLFFIHQLPTYGFNPLYVSIIAFTQAITLSLFYRAIKYTVLRDMRDVLFAIGRFSRSYILIAILAGISFALLYTFFATTPFVFFTLYFVVLTLLVLLRIKIVSFFERHSFSSSAHYDVQMEKELAEIDYTDPDLDIFETLGDILEKNVGTEKISIFLSSGGGVLQNFHNTKNEISINSPIFSHLVNEERDVVLRNQIGVVHILKPIANELEEFMQKNSAEVMFVLREGGTVFGALLLSAKRLENQYSDYDFKAFNTLYSYFFLAGYFMKNIANEEVVGTVSREIQMSGEIINSIQENVDPIENPKFDIGYLSMLAHDIGSEYIDFIKLNDTQHLFIIGDMSGKGINASMSVVIVKSIIRTFLAETEDFKLLIQKVNLFIRDNLPRGTFFSGLFGLIDDANNVLYYANCATPGLFMYNQVYN
ncbi:MAG TPA: SpoIIE family protein phosphatase, partial [Treponemataceae bacterium]|nr:SpoIIE family protein phosphatase [Treponemataceae bacterium]